VSGVTFTGTAVPAPLPHSVTLSWVPSSSPDVQGYNVYRSDVAGGTYVKMNTLPIPSIGYVDSSVTSGRTYYYVATAIDSNNAESAHSNQATAQIPIP
jgi:fibronectin type 3 domain-containing protein